MMIGSLIIIFFSRGGEFFCSFFGRLFWLDESGSLKELFERIEKTKLQVTCVEMDNRAIEHAKSLNINHLEQIEFVNQNIFKFRTEEKYDIVWSAGLFDYFDDKGFKMVLRKLFAMCTLYSGRVSASGMPRWY